MSRCHKDILNNSIFALKMSLLSKRHLMTVAINPTICHVMVMRVSCQSYAHPFK